MTIKAKPKAIITQRRKCREKKKLASLTLRCTAIDLCSDADMGVPCQRINPYKSSINWFWKDNVADRHSIKVASQNLKIDVEVLLKAKVTQQLLWVDEPTNPTSQPTNQSADRLANQPTSYV